MHIQSRHMTSLICRGYWLPSGGRQCLSTGWGPVYRSHLITHSPPIPLESRPSQELLSLPQMGCDLCLGLLDMPFPPQGTLLPHQPAPVLIRQCQPGNHFFRKAASATTTPLDTHTTPKVWAMCLPITAHTQLYHRTGLCPQSACSLRAGPVSALLTSASPRCLARNSVSVSTLYTR